MVAHSCKPSTWEAKTRESRVQVQPVIHTEFQASLGYRGKPCLKKQTCPLCVRRGSPPPWLWAAFPLPILSLNAVSLREKYQLNEDMRSYQSKEPDQESQSSLKPPQLAGTKLEHCTPQVWKARVPTECAMTEKLWPKLWDACKQSLLLIVLKYQGNDLPLLLLPIPLR